MLLEKGICCYFYRIKFIDMKSALFKVEIKLLYLIYI